MTEHIIIAGAGGQGVMLLGKLLATAVMKEGKFVTCLPSYGAEVRGGTAHCTVVISDSEVGSPYVSQADTLIIMNQPSLEKFSARLKNKGLLILNSSLAQGRIARARSLQCPFTDIALRLGNVKVANMVALGSYLAEKRIISAETVLAVMEEIAPPSKKDLVGINRQALISGMELKDGKG
jgi:2-oxoglutarate ferredoxin oxidoreductase subunit gamma